jgi:hypothetical protein
MKKALGIMLANEERGRSKGDPPYDTWLSNRNSGSFVSHSSADGLYARGLANVFEMRGTCTLTDEGRQVARSLFPPPCPDCNGLGCTCPGFCERPGRSDPDHACPTCDGKGVAPSEPEIEMIDGREHRRLGDGTCSGCNEAMAKFLDTLGARG